MMDIHELLDQMEDYTAREYRAEYRHFFELANNSAHDLMLNPDAICNADLVERDGVLYVYKFSDTSYKFREEDSVIVQDKTGIEKLLKSRNLEPHETGKEGTVIAIDHNEKLITVRGSGLPRKARILISCYRQNTILSDSITFVKHDLKQLPLIRAILNRQTSLKKGSPGELKKIEAHLRKNKDPNLKATISKALNLQNNFLAIQGPPGTGKTFTGANIITELLRQGRRVGITALSHKAINNLCLKVADTAALQGLIFSGCKAASKDRDRIQSDYFVNESGNHMVNSYGDYNLVAGTVWQFPRFDEGSLDYLVIDEAGQFGLAEAVGSCRGARNAIFLGDHRQLPQINQAAHPGESGKSVMEYLLKGRNTIPESLGVFLSETYRMNRDITDLISALSYDSRLKPHKTAAGRKLKVCTSKKDPLGPQGVAYIPVDHIGNDQHSPEEAKIVKKLVGRLKRGGIKNEEILIITPFRAQENEIHAKLGGNYRVGTVDRFQGQEGDVVICSMASSDPDSVPRGYDFLYSLNRLNVSLSRARKKSILLASPLLLEAVPDSIEKTKLVNALCRVKYHSLELMGIKG